MNRPGRTKDVPPAAAVCSCARCRAAAAGLGAGPFTPAQYAAIAPATVVPSTDDPVSSDPAVAAAEAVRDQARADYDRIAADWEAAIAAHRSAELLADDAYVYDEHDRPVAIRPGKGRRGLAELAQAEKDARERRDHAWKAVVRANDAVRAAQHAARLAAAGTARIK
jgi:hypothetical protein